MEMCRSPYMAYTIHIYRRLLGLDLQYIWCTLLMEIIGFKLKHSLMPAEVGVVVMNRIVGRIGP